MSKESKRSANPANRLANKELVVLDGAIGTELENRGIPQEHDASWAIALDTHPDTVQSVHESYVNAGATVITTNTYSSGYHALQRIQAADHFEAWNRRAVQLARTACDTAESSQQHFVAGSVSAFGNGAVRYTGTNDAIQWGESDLAVVQDNFERQTQVLVDEGADIIVLELLGAELTDIQVALEATQHSDVPVWVSLGVGAMSDADPVALQSIDGENAAATGTTLQHVIESISDCHASALLVHHLEIDLVDRVIDLLKMHWRGAIGVYPNRTGHWDGKQWVFAEDVTPERFARKAKLWNEAGASIIGGCCGIGPSHIAALSRLSSKL